MLRQIHFGTSAQMGNYLGGGDRAQFGAQVEWLARGQATQKPCGKQITRARCVDDLWDWMCRYGYRAPARNDDAAPLGAGQHGDLAIGSRKFASSVEIGCLIERRDFGFVGEHDVDLVSDQIQKAVAMAIDAKGIGERDGRFSAGLARDLCRELKCFLSFRPVP